MSAMALMVRPVRPSVARLVVGPGLDALVISDMGLPWLVRMQTRTSDVVSGLLRNPTKIEDPNRTANCSLNVSATLPAWVRYRTVVAFMAMVAPWLLRRP